MTRKPVIMLGLIVLSVLAAPSRTIAQLSAPISSRTFSEDWAWSQTVVLAEWHSARRRNAGNRGSTTFKIVRVLKGGGEEWEVGNRTRLPYYQNGKKGKTFLLFGDSTMGNRWKLSRRAKESTIPYMTQSPTPEKAPPERLSYFVRFLDSSDPFIAEDALHELSIAGTKHISAMPPDDLQLLQVSITRSVKEYRHSLEHLIAGYLLAKGRKGLDVIDESVLKNKEAGFLETYAAMLALRFIWSYEPGNISKDRLRQSMRILLEQPELTDLVIADLARWKDWSVQDRIMQMYDAPGLNNDARAIQRAIIRYMLLSTYDLPGEKKDKPPQHVVKGREYLATLKKKDQKTFRTVQRFNPPAPKVAKKPKRGRIDARGGIDAVASGLSFQRIYSYAIHTVSFSPNGKTLVSGSGDGTIRWWNAATGRRIETIKGHSTWCFSIAFRPDGQRMATGSGDRLIKIWDVSLREPIATLKGHTDDVHAVAFDPTGEQLFSAGDDMTVMVYNLKNRTILHRLKGHTEAIPCLAVSPHGNLMATGSRDDTIRVWDTATGEQRHLLKGHTNDVHSVTFSPDGKTLASASYDETVKLWDVKTGKVRRTLHGHTNWVFSVAYSADGTLIASGDKDGRIILWNSKTGKKLGVLKRQRHVSCVAFSPDGATLASSAPNATICLWDPQTLTFRRMLAVSRDENVAVKTK